jgi:hypothetical protein
MKHEEIVEHWLGPSFATLPMEQQLAALERGFTALWTRARGTLGDVTLGAIGERVLVHAQERFSFLDGATLAKEGLRCSDVKPPSSAVMAEATRYLLVQLLTILGRLTAEILTPALHDELMHAAHPSSGHVRPRAAADDPVGSKKKTAKAAKTAKTSKKPSKPKNKKHASRRGERS